jgi:hypothetical protein
MKVVIYMSTSEINQNWFQLNLDKRSFGDNVICLGEQLSSILETIKDETKECTWYIFDIAGSSKESILDIFQTDINTGICKINNTEELIESVRRIIQFERGVFIAIRKDVTLARNLNCIPETEEDERLQIPESEVEIRTFDYSYFDIYGTNEKIRIKLNDCFKV